MDPTRLLNRRGRPTLRFLYLVLAYFFALVVLRPVNALEVSVESVLETVNVTNSQVRSVAVNDEHLILGSVNGDLIEITAGGEFIRSLINRDDPLLFHSTRASALGVGAEMDLLFHQGQTSLVSTLIHRLSSGGFRASWARRGEFP